MQRVASRILYHFTGGPSPKDDQANFDRLCAILRSMTVRACRVGDSRCGIRTRWDPTRGLLNGEPIEQNVACLCDLLPEHWPFHARRYGKFGVGVCRSVAVQWGVRPAIYVPVSGKVHGSWAQLHLGEVSAVLEGLERFSAEARAERVRLVGAAVTDADDAMSQASSVIKRDYLAFVKFWDVDLPDDHEENFYLEREWRKFGDLPLASCLREVIAPPEYHDELKAIIAEMKAGDRYLLGAITCSSVQDVQS